MKNLEMETMELNEEELLEVDGGGHILGKIFDVARIVGGAITIPATDGLDTAWAAIDIADAGYDLFH